MAQPEKPESTKPAEAPKKRPIGLVVVAILVLAGGVFGFKTYSFNQDHASTDDAYVRLDVVPISPRVAGNIDQILAKENRLVKKGDLLVTLDDSTYRADLEQAEADLLAAKTGVEGAAANVTLSQDTSSAQLQQAQGSLAQGTTGIESATISIASAQSSVASAEAGVGAARAQQIASENAVLTQRSTILRAQEQAKALEATVASAEAAVKLARANVKSAEATASNAEREAERVRTLAEEGGISGSVADQRATAAASARAQVDAANQSLAGAEANVLQQKANLLAARQAVKEAQGAVRQAQAQVEAARQNVQAHVAQVNEAQSGVVAARKSVSAAQAIQAQALGRLHEAQTAPTKVSIDAASKKTAEAKVAQAQAAVDRAKIALSRTKIYSPVDGYVNQKTVQPGQQVTVGQPLMSIVPVELPWVIANFKETQLAGMHPGQKVEIEIDAIPGHKFEGHIDSIARGTGATFALLPPDNATGNFTKVVQRLPVKILLEPGQEKLDLLHAGLSAAVVVQLKD